MYIKNVVDNYFSGSIHEHEPFVRKQQQNNSKKSLKRHDVFSSDSKSRRQSPNATLNLNSSSYNEIPTPLKGSALNLSALALAAAAAHRSTAITIKRGIRMAIS